MLNDQTITTAKQDNRRGPIDKLEISLGYRQNDYKTTDAKEQTVKAFAQFFDVFERAIATSDAGSYNFKVKGEINSLPPVHFFELSGTGLLCDPINAQASQLRTLLTTLKAIEQQYLEHLQARNQDTVHHSLTLELTIFPEL